MNLSNIFSFFFFRGNMLDNGCLLLWESLGEVLLLGFGWLLLDENSCDLPTGGICVCNNCNNYYG